MRLKPMTPRLRLLCALVLLPATHALGQWQATAHEPFVPPVKANHKGEAYHFVFNWGDGSTGYSGVEVMAYANSHEHVWHEPGTYNVQWYSVSLSGEQSPVQSASVTVAPAKATATESAAQPALLRPLGYMAGGAPAQRLRSGNWHSGTQSNPLDGGWIGMRFNGHQSLNRLQIVPATGQPFPTALRIDYSTDGGQSWHTIPSTVVSQLQMEDSAEALSIPLRGVVANAVRIYVPLLPAEAAPLNGYGFHLGGLNAYAEANGPRFGAIPFNSDIAALNNLWIIFGSSANEAHTSFNNLWPSPRPNQGGVLSYGSAEWMSWNAAKLAWQADPALRNLLATQLLQTRLSDDGYVWASPGGEKHLNHSRHYTTNATFVTGASRLLLQTGDLSLLDRSERAGSATLGEKLEQAVRYMLEDLGGNSGLLRTTDPDNDGTPKGEANNYWDAWRFGYLDAHANLYFHEALEHWAQVLRLKGKSAEADRIDALLQRARKAFSETFWSDETGRFVGAIDTTGKAWDYGFTFLNLHAVASGAASPSQAAQIFSWIDGRRRVRGDTTDDIYRFGLSPVTNTRDAAADPEPLWWESWSGAASPLPGGPSAYGVQMQNGGTIFYTSYHDLMARSRHNGAADAWKRAQGIFAEYDKDELRRDPVGPEARTEIVGVIGEFPESGLVPLYATDVLLGLRPGAAGLKIAPALPQHLTVFAVRDYHYHGRNWIIIADKSLSAPVVEAEHNTVRVPASRAWRLTPEGNITPWN